MHNRYVFFLIALTFFAMNVALTFGKIYRDALFLSYYPSAWLSYLFLGTVILNCMVFSLLLPIIKLRNKYINRAIVAFLLALGCLWTLLMPLNLSWVPFAYALYYSLIFPILSILCFNLASDSFSIREFKQHSTKFRAIGTSAIILSANATSLLIANFNLDILLYLTLACIALIEVILCILNPISQQIEGAVLQKGTIWKYPLMRTVLPMAIFMSIGYYTSDYLLKYKISQQMSKNEIATFMGHFISTLSILSLGMQLFVSEKIINRLGITSAFYIPATVILVSCSLLLVFSNLWVLTVLVMCVFLGYSGIYQMAFETVLLPLPAQIRISAKALEEGILMFIGQGITALFFICLAAFNLSENAKMLTVLFFTMGCCLPWYYLIPKLKLFYQESLEDAIRVRGFTVESALTSHSHEWNIQDVALNVLQSPNPMAHPVAYFMLKNESQLSSATWEILQEKLADASELERIQAIHCLANKNLRLYLPQLLERLLKETHPNVIWELVQLLTPIQSSLVRPLIESIFQQNISEKQVYMVPLALYCGEFKIIKKSLQVLEKAYEHGDPGIHIALMRVIGLIPIGKFDNILSMMLKQPHEDVVVEAIKAAQQRHMTELIPEIMANLGRPNISYAASNALLSFGEEIVPSLELLALKEQRLEHSLIAVKILASIPGKKAEEAIFKVAGSRNALIITRLAECSIHANCTFNRSLDYKQKVYDLILKESALRDKYKSALHLSLPQYLLNELQVKLHMTSLRCLYWYGSYIDPEKVSQLISPLKDIDFDYHRQNKGLMDSISHARQHSVLELLGSLTKDKQLKNIFNTWELAPKAKYEVNPLAEFQGLDFYIDLLIKHSWRYEKGDIMKITEKDVQKLIILREIKLFEKLPSEVLHVMAREASFREIFHGEVLFEEGSPANELFIIVSGEVTIISKSKTTTQLKENDFFGEIGILNNSPRLATAVVASDGKLLVLDQATMDHIIDEFPDVLRVIMRMVISYLQAQPA